MGAGTGVVPAIALVSLLGVISAHTFERIGFASHLTKEETFKGIWSKTIGSRTAWVVDLAVLLMCVSVCIIYLGIMGDVLTSLMELFGVPAHFNQRPRNIITLAVSILLPLSLQKDLSGLAFTSIIGFSAVVYTVLFMAVRAVDGSYRPTGTWATKLAADKKPDFTGLTPWTLSTKVLFLVNNLGLAYMAHYNGPVFYRELEARSPSRFRVAVRRSFVIITALYIVTMVSGFATFGRTTASNILNSYHGDDPLAVVGRIATGVSVLFGFPLAFVGVKEASRSLLTLGGPVLSALGEQYVPIVVVLMSFVTFVACVVKDIGLLVGISGAVLGALIVYIFPTLVWVEANRRYDPANHRAARLYNAPLVPFGVFVGALGVYMTLSNS